MTHQATDWRGLIVAEDADELALHASRALGLPVGLFPGKAFLAECRRAMGEVEAGRREKLGSPAGKTSPWSEGTWIAWIKVRALVLGCYPVGRSDACFIRWASCLLHTGFLFIEENEVHWRRLRSPEPKQDDGPARSRIGKTVEIIQPIDRVAARVI